ncbi:MAG: single-stranded-DNA-specific exonuclease RecJ [Lachnospiraceae bacterium]|jgi:single-stranded-DNA-specific exonuclease|nr:single-stranded-DNA-specific exonuclease RecJ [Lachnospiraceae bacterium]MCI1327901.1 single-stranded-DNA-specific exonuclease RecJ [Lachnospiraceae bacterium]
MKKKWVVLMKKADFNGIGRKYGIDPVIARLIRNREVTGDEAIRKYLYGSPEDLYDPMLLKGMEEACGIIADAVQRGRKIRVIGDYDIDGVMSSYILLTGLRVIGGNADVRIPNRMIDGYGLNANLVRAAKKDGKELIVTCDNGIAAAGAVALAKELGMKTVVTDHHEVPFEQGDDGKRRYRLPGADSVIDPKQEGCAYPFKELCGAGVAFKLVSALYDRFQIPQEKKEDLLQYVAFATVGDVVSLTDENRILVREGLKRLRKTDNRGLAALIRENELDPERINSYQIGFVLGPCVNASGRLNTAARALKMLCAKTEEEASALAKDLIRLNKTRQDMTEQAASEAYELVDSTGLSEDRVLVVHLPDCHESIAGIVAGRLRERYYRPAIVLSGRGNKVKGSGRSIEGYDMFAEISACGGYLTKFGGHRMAAGMSLEEANIGPFRSALNRACTLTGDDLTEKVVIDVPMPVTYVTRELVRQLDLLEPFGTGNPKPVFAQSGLRAMQTRVFGKNRNVAKCRLVDENGRAADAVYFGEADAFAEYVSTHGTISVIYYPAIDSYRGADSLQMIIREYE